MTSFYAHFFNTIDSYVGPFSSAAECDAHAALTAKYDDSYQYFGVVDALPKDYRALNPEFDLDLAKESAIIHCADLTEANRLLELHPDFDSYHDDSGYFIAPI